MTPNQQDYGGPGLRAKISSAIPGTYDQDLEQAFGSIYYSSHYQNAREYGTHHSISSGDSFCSVTPFALANLGIFLQSNRLLHFSLVYKLRLIFRSIFTS